MTVRSLVRVEVQPPRPVDSDQLVGVAELAEHFRVHRSTITKWDARRRRTGFPLPVARPLMGALYDKGEVIGWYRHRKGEDA